MSSRTYQESTEREVRVHRCQPSLRLAQMSGRHDTIVVKMSSKSGSCHACTAFGRVIRLNPPEVSVHLGRAVLLSIAFVSAIPLAGTPPHNQAATSGAHPGRSEGIAAWQQIYPRMLELSSEGLLSPLWRPAGVPAPERELHGTG